MYQKAWESANETEALTPFTKKLRERLATLRPEEFKNIIEDMPKPSYYTSNIVLTRETTVLLKN